MNHEGAYYVIEFPVNQPWQREEHRNESETKNEEENEEDGDVDITETADEESRQESKGTFAHAPVAACSAGVMEYVNRFGETKARINYEYRPRDPARPRSTRSRLKVTPDLVGRSFHLVRERRQASAGSARHRDGGDINTATSATVR